MLQYTLINPVYDLHRDEYLHLDQARHLAWGYVSVPPLTSWTSYVILLLGNGVFWVKFFPALFGALTIVIAWKAVEDLGGSLFAQVLAATALTFSVLLRVNMLYQPNSLDILSWTVLYYSILKHVQTGKNKWIWSSALALAFGFLNKYNIVFAVIGLLPALLIEQRKIFSNKHLYFAMLVALCIVSPNLVWQYQNHFPVIHHMQDLTATQLVNVKRSDFIKEQFIFFIGSFYIVIASLISVFVYPAFKKYRFLAWSFFITLLVFIYLKAKGYYAIGLYPVLFAVGAVYLERILMGRKRWIRPVPVLVIVLSFIPFMRVAFPFSKPEQIEREAARFKKLDLLKWEDGKNHSLPQDFADMLGWRELAAKTDGVYDSIADPSHTLILCDNYGEAGAINYYSAHKNINAVSFNADYIHWIQLDREIKYIIAVNESGDSISFNTRHLFRNIQLKNILKNRYAREYGTTISVWSQPVTPVNTILEGAVRNLELQ